MILTIVINGVVRTDVHCCSSRRFIHCRPIYRLDDLAGEPIIRRSIYYVYY